MGIQGQSHAKRALQIAVAGGHHCLLTGPPGVGKTMMAEGSAKLFPALSKEAYIQRLVELLQAEPDRSLLPDSSVTPITLPVPANRTQIEASLRMARNALLFVDEIPLTSPFLKERLLALLESPDAPLVIAAMNHCPCGKADGRGGGGCVCTAAEKSRYAKRLSAPLRERFAIHVGMDNAVAVLESQQISQQPLKQLFPNSTLVEEVLWPQIENNVRSFVDAATTQLQFSLRVRTNLLRVARTIADLAGCKTVALAHVQEAMQYRPLSASL